MKTPHGYRPDPRRIDELVRKAADHPLGLDFLREGPQDAVAATFGVHAFDVDAARKLLKAPVTRR